MFQINFLKNESPEILFWQALGLLWVSPRMSVGRAIPCPSQMQLTAGVPYSDGCVQSHWSEQGWHHSVSHNAVRRCCLHVFQVQFTCQQLKNCSCGNYQQCTSFCRIPSVHLIGLRLQLVRRLRKKSSCVKSLFHYRWINILTTVQVWG